MTKQFCSLTFFYFLNSCFYFCPHQLCNKFAKETILFNFGVQNNWIMVAEKIFCFQILILGPKCIFFVFCSIKSGKMPFLILHCRFFDQNLRGIFLYENGYIFQIKCTPNKCCHINPGQNHFFSRNIYPFLKKEQNCDFSTPVCSKFKGNFSPWKWAYISD